MWLSRWTPLSSYGRSWGNEIDITRLLALAEVVWSPRNRRDWVSFEARLPAALARLDALDVTYRPLFAEDADTR